jgi:hypothetical protein
MKNIISTFVISLWLITGISNGQDITNTLAPNGNFKIKDGSADYLSLSQANGYLSLNRSLILPNTTSPSLGVIFKGADRFIHNYGAYNTFMGINASNFTLTTATYNTGIGHSSLSNLTTGHSNTALGYGSLYSNTTGYQNTALGYESLSFNTEGFHNTTVGYQSLLLNTIGFFNTALGSKSLLSNTTGSENTALGYQSLFSNTTGYYNTANGLQTLYNNTTGHSNTANGMNALYYNTTGYYNTANGMDALYSNTTGSLNTATGYQSLYSNTTGFYNTALGYSSGTGITTGSNLTCIGNNAEPTSGTAANQITLGDNQVTSLRCNVQTITSLSDARDKKNIKDLSLGINFIMKLKPRIYNWDKREWYEDNKSDGSKMKEEPTAGFIAQELDAAQITSNAEWLNLVLKDNPEKWEATPGNLFPVLVKAVQELKTEKDSEIAKITEENQQLRSELEDLKVIKEQLADIQGLKEELIEQINMLRDSSSEDKVKFSSIENQGE